MSGSTSHKAVTKEQSRILWLYYNNSVSKPTLILFSNSDPDQSPVASRPLPPALATRHLHAPPLQNVLFAFCAGNEAFFVALYLLKWYTTALLPTSAGLHVFEALTSHGVPAVVAHAVAGVTFPQIIAGLTFPVMFLKQAINCVQIGKAAQLLVDADLEDRWEKQHAKGK